MSFLYRFFPRAMKARDMIELLISCGIYLLLLFAAGLAVAVLSVFFLPLSSLWFILGGVAGLYAVAGLILSALCYFDVL